MRLTIAVLIVAVLMVLRIAIQKRAVPPFGKTGRRAGTNCTSVECDDCGPDVAAGRTQSGKLK